MKVGWVVVLLVVAAQGVAWGASTVIVDRPSTLELTVKCLTAEKHLRLASPGRDAVARAASGGAFRTSVEGNGVTVSLGADHDQSALTVERYERIAGPLPGRLIRRGSAVYLFDMPASPTQLQTLIDCEYAR